MNDTIKALVGKIQDLEREAEGELNEQRLRFQYSVREKRIRFEAAAARQHRELKLGLFRFVRESGLVGLLISPIIYLQIIPLLLLDLAVTLFQLIAFSAYGIEKVPREDFIVLDRNHLPYLNAIEKLNCDFCGYANGLLAYSREIAGRAEEHWCPIKHARKTSGQHRRYYGFTDYGDAEGFRSRPAKDEVPPKE